MIFSLFLLIVLFGKLIFLSTFSCFVSLLFLNFHLLLILICFVSFSILSQCLFHLPLYFLSGVSLTAAEMKYMRRTAGYTWTDCETNAETAKELRITPILDKLLEYKRSWIQHVIRMPRNRLPRVMKHYSPTGRRNHGRPLKRLLDT